MQFVCKVSLEKYAYNKNRQSTQIHRSTQKKFSNDYWLNFIFHCSILIPFANSPYIYDFILSQLPLFHVKPNARYRKLHTADKTAYIFFSFLAVLFFIS